VTELLLDLELQEGTRLHSLELLNWGTFDGSVWRLETQDGNCLLTGQVGAGKSTIVDAITTLLVPANRVTFNQAAGAGSRERTLTTYALGQFRHVLDETTATSRPEFLRKPATAFTALLATFSKPAGGFVTAGLVLTFPNATSAPSKLFLLSADQLTIAEHLTGHSDLRTLRGSLRSAGVDLHQDNFSSYQKALCKALGVKPAALALFAQTVSMKQVGNLTDFVRSHMLDAPDIDATIAGMLEHYGDLTHAHDVVVDARRQLAALDLIADEAAKYDRTSERIRAVEAAIPLAASRVDELRHALLTAAIAEADALLPILSGKKAALVESRAAVGDQLTQLAIRLSSSGGDQLGRAELQRDGAKDRLSAVTRAATELTELAGRAELQPPRDEADFARFRQAIAGAAEGIGTEREALSTRQGEAYGEMRASRQALEQLEAELVAAGERDSNIPLDLSRLRDHLAQETGIGAQDLPFAGELLAVAAEAADWEPAAERLTRGFALSLLVPEQHYAQVSAWVDRTHLGRKLVYYRVPADVTRVGAPKPGSLADKLQVRPGSPLSGWLSGEVARRFDHECVADASGLTRASRAITLAGLIKDNQRHEKDDRGSLDDRTRFVLGWDTRARRTALTHARPAMDDRLLRAEQAFGDAGRQEVALRARDTAVEGLTIRFTTFADVDAATAALDVQRAEEHLALLANNPVLQQLTEQRTRLESDGAELDAQISELGEQIGATKATRGAQELQFAALVLVDTTDVPAPTETAYRDAVRSLGEPPTSPEDCERWAHRLRTVLGETAASAGETLKRQRSSLVAAMNAFGNGWPSMVDEISTSDPDSRGELLNLRTRLLADDLPAFEANFKEQLEHNAIHEIAVFHNNLDAASRRIADRVATINKALADIEYRPGSFIRLEAERTADQLIRDFRAQLQRITEDSLLGGDDAYSEERFLLVRDLLDRFRGREGSSAADRSWTERVTDVRNWFTFAASERSRDEDAQIEHYTDSGGKSGGQKEKLAYTILAASLYYQYGLAEGASDAFRFVMIDEAFGRGSDESTRFGLDLFTRLGLQLLVVTPLQKVATIEPYVQSVGFVSTNDRYSQLVTMTITEYREKVAAHRDQQRGGHTADD